jgi:hypothetical protein
MARPCNKPLKVNPFISRRDPKTGRWQIIKQRPRNPIQFLGPSHLQGVVLAPVNGQTPAGLCLMT